MNSGERHQRADMVGTWWKGGTIPRGLAWLGRLHDGRSWHMRSGACLQASLALWCCVRTQVDALATWQSTLHRHRHCRWKLRPSAVHTPAFR